MRAPALIALALLLPLGSALAQEGSPLPRGKALYDKYCSQCHGGTGNGQGYATPYLRPQPRDFTAGKYKIRTTPSGGVPTDADLKHIIQVGIPFTAMPAFPDFPPAELDELVQYVKSFADDFEDPEARLDPITIPEPPTFDAATAEEQGRKVWEETGCSRCHGDVGRGDGNAAPTLVDDWGHFIRAADLTKPWTFRGGATRKDIFRTMSTGFSGTPMPGFHGSLPVEDIWAITDYIVSLGGNRTTPPYTNLLRAVGAAGDLDLEQGRELFAEAPSAHFRIVGQIIEPGRQFYPAAVEVEARAVYDRDEIAFMVSWNDMRAETSGENAPDLPAPLWAEEVDVSGSDDASDEDEGGFWGDAAEEEENDPWGDLAVDEDEAADAWGDLAVDEDEGGDDFWGESEEETQAASGPDTEFSDAVAIQLPQKLPQGVARPYFLFGDAQNPVDLWFVDLARPEESTVYVARGSSAIAPAEGGEPDVWSEYDAGRWTVIFKREREAVSGLQFEEGIFFPVAFSVWDGFNRERGKRRGLTQWYSVYLEPLEAPSVVPPMAKAFAGILALELLIVGLVRRRKAKAAA